MTEPQEAFSKVVFASYAKFDSHSAGHVAGFANGLAGLGYAVAVCGASKIFSAHEHGYPAFEYFTLADLKTDPHAVIGFDGEFDPARTLLICWTPRELVRQAAAPLIERYAMRAIVHLEDNEEHLTALRLKDKKSLVPSAFPVSAAHPQKYKEFLAAAAGVTFIARKLAEFAPPGVPTLLLEPGVDLATLGAPLPKIRRATIRRALGIAPGAKLIVYPGNTHRANVEEMGALYESVAMLRAAGHNVVLVRTGSDYDAELDFLRAASPAGGIVSLGRVERTFLVDLLRAADLFVQPGRAGPFNDYRLPSKIPEFMAVGRPVVMPNANLGTEMRDGADALILADGSAAEIARRVVQILTDPALAERLGRNARKIAEARFAWPPQVAALADFAAAIMRR